MDFLLHKIETNKQLVDVLNNNAVQTVYIMDSVIMVLITITALHILHQGQIVVSNY